MVDPAILGREKMATRLRLRAGMLDAERRKLLRLRDGGEIGDEVMFEVQRHLDLEDVLIDSTEPVE